LHPESAELVSPKGRVIAFELTGFTFVFYNERTLKALPSSAWQLQLMIADGSGMNSVARAD
jgi:hypothetical protein